MKTLKLFNAVIAKQSLNKPFVSEQGFIIESNALWAKKEIIKFYKDDQLDGYGLNKTFHKSWSRILYGSRESLWIDQIRHYISTYGGGFQDEIYIPEEILDVPGSKVCFKVVKAYTEAEMTNKCLTLLQSGIALKEETLDDVLSVLVDELSFKFTGKENIKNKEAVIKLADMYGVLPSGTMEFFRYIIYRATGESLLIKNDDTIAAIKASNFNPAVQLDRFGLEKMAEIFNRFKPLFLAFKPKCGKTINKISKLSKTCHKPMVVNPLNYVTSMLLSKSDIYWLDNATPFALFKALSACHTRINGQNSFLYRVRNGKSFVKEGGVKQVVWENYQLLENYLKTRFDVSGKTFFIPRDVKFALPTSEKMYVDNIPTGTKFYGAALAVGVYWENIWGANDIDLAGLNIGGKIGWNSMYNQHGGLLYSGDITDAPKGAVEYLYASKGLTMPTLVNSNVFLGSSNCDYKIVIGKGDSVDYNYMMKPDNLFAEVKCQSVQKQTILGMLIPEGKEQSFVLLNFGAGQARVSGNSEISNLATQALYQQWKSPIMLNDMIELLGGELITDKDKADYDFSLDSLGKDSLMKVFMEKDL
ncbi:MAG: hypothetical protein BM557_02785 [Flavobacterium sp. MedPE-SWcel]|uniref:hypothetical protein n=1 Tax=uncultured Flavobacterium sp. TaxID=165435 RepID=UPI00091CB6DE|nr:hypothetical protein [uncultured Flavobacterium sp.]OIQ21739.1 MAG: hypothetical protein BM557_02785 [Flavobacterium sp. MedPE-SWcel]